MSKRKKQTGRYVVEINDWGCGTMIKDTLTGKEIDAPAEETVNLCLAEMNRLAAEVERLKKPEIIGGYNLSEYIRMAHSETLEFDNGDIFAGMTLPERIKYIVESHARLQSEVERLKFEIEVHRQNWNSEDIYNHECKLEVEKMRRAAKEGKTK